jgi:hypothetical protein
MKIKNNFKLKNIFYFLEWLPELKNKKNVKADIFA